jgi:zinc protease
MIRRIFLIAVAVTLLCSALSAQPAAQSPAGQPVSMKGVVLKGKAPVSDNVLSVKLPRPQEADMPNGVHLMVLEDHRLPQVTMAVIIHGAGGYYDPANSSGLAVFTAAMMMEGTKTRTAQQIAKEQETMASSLGVGSGMSNEMATVSISCLADNFDKTLNLAADVLLNPSFPEEELARFKMRQRAQALQVRSLPRFLVQERYARAIYGDHPASRIFPTIEAIDKVTRDSLIEFHRAHYIPDYAIVAVVGDIKFAEAKTKLESALGGWKKGASSVPPVQDPAPLKGSSVFLVDRPNSVQTSLIIATQAINRTSPDYDVLNLLNTVIGGGPTGRLFLNLREEKGWTYGAYSNVDAPKYRGSWLAQTEIRGDVTEPAIGEILNEIKRARTEPVPDKEFLEKKRSLVASFALSLESPTTIVNNYIISRLYNLPADYWDKYPERIMAITKEQVQATANKYLDPGRLQIVAVGDGKKIGEGLKKCGSVETYDTEGKPKPASVP